MVLRFSSGIISFGSAMEPRGNEMLRKESVMSTSVLRDLGLFQNLPLNSKGSH